MTLFINLNRILFFSNIQFIKPLMSFLFIAVEDPCAPYFSALATAAAYKARIAWDNIEMIRTSTCATTQTKGLRAMVG